MNERNERQENATMCIVPIRCCSLREYASNRDNVKASFEFARDAEHLVLGVKRNEGIQVQKKNKVQGGKRWKAKKDGIYVK